MKGVGYSKRRKMADINTIGHVEDTGRGKELKTGGMRRSYNKKKKKKKSPKEFRIVNTKYVAGK